MAERRNNYQIQVIGGEKLPGADIGYAIELIDGLRIFVQLWHGDEEFPPRLRCLWDENTQRYLSNDGLEVS